MTTPDAPSTGRRAWLWAEMALIFIGLPAAIAMFPGILGGGVLFLLLWTGGAACTLYLLYDKRFERRKLWNFRIAYDRLGVVLLRWLILISVVMFLYGLAAGHHIGGLRFPTGLFGLPREIPVLWAVIMLAYPWFSVFPQNLIYRAFFCQRYAPILGSGWAMILLNAALFSFGHIMFGNWVVLGLTLVGGALFTRTYLRHGSLLLATIEHALYGSFCFSVGIGIFLLYGSGN
ncbi:MAG: CPBP family intramembrane glutamic endopeptidase [Phycisphaerales bacterium JB063]